jgi:hypothetical protein
MTTSGWHPSTLRNIKADLTALNNQSTPDLKSAGNINQLQSNMTGHAHTERTAARACIRKRLFLYGRRQLVITAGIRDHGV